MAPYTPTKAISSARPRSGSTARIAVWGGISLELTLNELVDVTVETVGQVMRDGVTEAVWEVPVILARPVEHETRRVLLAP